jgi:hypothetical protein
MFDNSEIVAQARLFMKDAGWEERFGDKWRPVDLPQFLASFVQFLEEQKCALCGGQILWQGNEKQWEHASGLQPGHRAVASRG